MKTITDPTLDTLLAPSSGETITPGHRAWMNAQISETLAKKARGEATYTPLEKVRKDFGL